MTKQMMTGAKLAAIQAQLVDMRNVGTHKSLKLTLHIAEEYALKAIETFGWPTGAHPVDVVLAQLDLSKIAGNAPSLPEAPAREAESSKAAPPASASQLTTRAVMIAKEPLFRRFVELETKSPMGEITEEAATEYIRKTCQVESRSEIRPGTAAGDRFCFILSAYIAWKERDRYVAA